MRVERQFLFWLGAFVATVLFVAVFKDVLLPFIAGMILAYALNPLADLLVRVGAPRVVASAVVVALIVAGIGMALVFLVPPLLSQLQNLADTAPAMMGQLRDLVEEIARTRLGAERFATFKTGLDQAIAGMQIDWSAVVPAVLRSLWSQGLAVMNIVSFMLITPLVVFYLLVDWHPMLDKIDSWLPRERAPTIRRLAGEMDAAIAAFIRGQGLLCLTLGVFYAIGLSWAGLRYGLLIGLTTGILSFIPFVGWATGLLVSSLMILIQAWPDLIPLYKVIGVFMAGMAFDAALLAPYMVGSRVGLHPLWLIFALFVFGYALGFVGMLVAVPLAAAAAVLVRYGIEVYVGSDVYRGKAAPVPVRVAGGDGAPPS